MTSPGDEPFLDAHPQREMSPILDERPAQIQALDDRASIRTSWLERDHLKLTER